MKNNNVQQKDWRRQGQERYLMRLTLIFHKYQPYRKDWDHDHCEFCGKKFSLNDEDMNEGYSTIDHYRWICIDCFNDFKDEFNWSYEKG